jgi:hypothetical protein
LRETVMPTLEVRYSVLNLISRLFLGVGFGLVFWFFASQMKPKGWFTTISYAAAVVFVGVALASLYRLLTARGQAVVLIDATGFQDTRLTPTVIPWSAIRSVSPYIPYKSRKATGVSLAIDPSFKPGLSIRLGAKLFRWANLSFGSNFVVDLGTLDVEVDEISRVAESYISKQA